jgi:hypothetical protein
VNTCPPIVNVPCRVCVAALAAAENETEPLPLPLAVPVTLSQPGASLTAVQLQPAGAVIAVDPVPPPAATEALSGDSEYVQATPAWFTVNVWPPIVSVPCRPWLPLFAEAENDTVPLPVPLEPAVTVNQLGALLAAVQEQFEDVVSDVVLLPPVATTDVDVGFNVKVQPAAAWFTVYV